MMRRRRPGSGLPPLLIAMLVISTFACRKIKDGGGAGTETAAEIPLPANGSQLVMKDFKDALKPYLHGPTHTYKRDGLKCNSCVATEIESIGLTTDIGPGKPPAKDRVVATIRNKNDDDEIEALYGIEPEKKTEYFIWATNDGYYRWTLVSLTKIAGGMATVGYAKTGHIQKCGPGSGPSDADFKKCEDIHPPVGATKSSMISTELLGSMLTWARHKIQVTDTSLRLPGDPAWLRCSYGCCTAASL
jgi:hypothetical protein